MPKSIETKKTFTHWVACPVLGLEKWEYWEGHFPMFLGLLRGKGDEGYPQTYSQVWITKDDPWDDSCKK